MDKIMGQFVFNIGEKKMGNIYSNLTLLERMEKMDELDQQIVDLRRKMDAIREDANNYNKWYFYNVQLGALLKEKQKLGGN